MESSSSLPFGIGDHVIVDSGRSLALSEGKAYLLDSSTTPLQSIVVPPGTFALCAEAGVCYTLQQGPDSSIIYTPLDLNVMKVLVPASIALAEGRVAALSDFRFVDKNDVLWTVDRAQRSLSSWSARTGAFGRGIQLRGDVYSAVYSVENHSIYLSYSDGVVTVVDLSLEYIAERLFKMVANVGRALDMAGSLLVVRTEGAGVDVYDVQAKRLVRSSAYFTEEPGVWDASGKVLSTLQTSLYTLDAGRFCCYTVTEEAFTQLSVVDAKTSKLTIVGPLRLGGGNALLGSGQLCDLKGETLKASLPRAHVDAQYVNGSWFTLYSNWEGSLVNKWDSTLGSVVKAASLPGRPVALFPLSGNRLLVLSDRYGAPVYSILDDQLNVQKRSVPPQPSRLANLSVQADAGVGMDALVPGFVLNGTVPKTVLLRGSGPGLAAFNVANCLVDPTMTVYTRPGGVLDTNDNWGDLPAQRELRERSADLYAVPLSQGSKDAVLLAKLWPEAYSAQVQGVNNGVGRALVEIYDAEQAPGDSRLVNLSARCKISKGSQAIGGFVIHGGKPMKLLIRAVGPGLSKYSVNGVSADPKLRVFSGSKVIAENNDWSFDPNEAASLLAAFAATGAFVLDTGSKDAAVLVELQPGNYTVYMESADGGSGVGLLEIYEVN